MRHEFSYIEKSKCLRKHAQVLSCNAMQAPSCASWEIGDLLPVIDGLMQLRVELRKTLHLGVKNTGGCGRCRFHF